MTPPSQRKSSIGNLSEFVASTIGLVGDVVRWNGAVLVASPVPVANGFVNSAFVVDSYADRRSLIEEALVHFGDRETPFIVWVPEEDRSLRDEVVRFGGIVDHEPSPDMWVDVPIAHESDLDVRVVEDADDFDLCARLCEQGYGIDGMAWLMKHHRMIDARGVRWVIAFDGGTPVGTGCGFLDRGVGGIYYVATPPEFARRGVASAVTTSLVNDLLVEGAEYVVLQASMQGFPVYERLGFSTRGRLERYRFDVPSGD